MGIIEKLSLVKYQVSHTTHIVAVGIQRRCSGRVTPDRAMGHPGGYWLRIRVSAVPEADVLLFSWHSLLRRRIGAHHTE